MKEGGFIRRDGLILFITKEITDYTLFGQKFLAFMSICGSSQNCCHKKGSTQLRVKPVLKQYLENHKKVVFVL